MEQSTETRSALPGTMEEAQGEVSFVARELGRAPENAETVGYTRLSETSSMVKLDVCNILAGLLYGVKTDGFDTYSRQERRVNEARQLGIYLANTCLGVSYEDIALPARRDRSTVRYSIERVEDRRENPQFDMALVAIETFVGCLLDRDSVEMIRTGLQVDFDRIAWTPLAGMAVDVGEESE